MKARTILRAAAGVLLLIGSACASSSGPRAVATLSTPGAQPGSTPAATRSLPTLQGESGPTPSAPGPTKDTPATQQPGSTALATRSAPLGSATPAKSPASVTVFPDPAGYAWQAVANGFDRPLAVSGDRQGHLLVAEQAGVIWVVENGDRRAEPFLDIRERVGSQGNEQGLLGLVLHPDYPRSSFIYVNYTDRNGNTVIARFSVDPAAGSARADSEQVLLKVQQPYPNHNGGSMVFGPDGFLYMGLGDGGSGGDPQGNGQNLNTLLGKLLRIDVNQGEPYAIPAGNPFLAGGGKAEIWAVGLRNPWRFSFDRATGDLYIADVGQNSYEEIDFLPANAPGGANFGWSLREGLHPFKDGPAPASGLVDPVFEYQHPQGCSVTGGYVYRGAALPELAGIYLFGDYCNGKIWGLLRGMDGTWKNQLLFKAGVFISSFGEDDQGELYLCDQQNGVILHLVRK